MAYIPGQGIKKPMNMMQAPIYPDIRKGPIQFKNSGKYWQVDVGQTLLDTEPNTQILEDAVLAKSYRDNIDKYGQSSYQEKITVFRPPLQNDYEDFGPLNRLPTKIRAITPYINPGTITDGSGSTAFAAYNQTIQEVDRYITDKVTTPSWRNTYHMPMEAQLDTSMLPDLVTTLPLHSASSGYFSNVNIDAPREVKLSEVQKVETSVHSGYSPKYNTSLNDQTSSFIDLHENTPQASAHSGFSSPYTANVETRLDELDFDTNLPTRSVTAGMRSNYTVDGDNRMRDMVLSRGSPTISASAGYTPITTFDGETRLDELQFDQALTTRLRVSNPGSEHGYQTRVESYTSPDDYIKIRENPKVAVMARPVFGYKNDENTRSKETHVQRKLEPVKSYNSGLNAGTIHTYGVEEQNVGGRYFANRKTAVQ
jgi:hypothetical protein